MDFLLCIFFFHFYSLLCLFSSLSYSPLLFLLSFSFYLSSFSSLPIYISPLTRIYSPLIRQYIHFNLTQVRTEYHDVFILNFWVWFLTAIALCTILTVNLIYIKNFFFIGKELNEDDYSRYNNISL